MTICELCKHWIPPTLHYCWLCYFGSVKCNMTFVLYNTVMDMLHEQQTGMYRNSTIKVETTSDHGRTE